MDNGAFLSQSMRKRKREGRCNAAVAYLLVKRQDDIMSLTPANHLSTPCPRTYAILYDGETISLDNVSCSAFPFSGGSIRNPSQSSVSLQKSRRAHKQHVAGTSNSSIYTNSSQGTSSRQTTQSPISRWLNMPHISPAIPVATQRYKDRPTM